jgi:DNA-binding IclR family transcriptional regulator
MGRLGFTRDRRAARGRSFGCRLITNHAAVLAVIARDPRLRLEQIAERVGVSARAAQRIVADLEQSGYVEVRRNGRCNAYRVLLDAPVRHTGLDRPAEVAALLAALDPRTGQSIDTSRADTTTLSG